MALNFFHMMLNQNHVKMVHPLTAVKLRVLKFSVYLVCLNISQTVYLHKPTRYCSYKLHIRRSDF
jgi:hypothetical protein